MWGSSTDRSSPDKVPASVSIHYDVNLTPKSAFSAENQDESLGMRPALGVAMLDVQRGCLACKGIPVVLNGCSGMMGDEREKRVESLPTVRRSSSYIISSCGLFILALGRLTEDSA